MSETVGVIRSEFTSDETGDKLAGMSQKYSEEDADPEVS